jgi:hypothetical protein
MRRYNWLAAPGIFVVAVCLWPLLPQFGRPVEFMHAKFHRIKVGMTRAEVVAILGSPGDHTTRDVENDPAADGVPHEKWTRG